MHSEATTLALPSTGKATAARLRGGGLGCRDPIENGLGSGWEMG